MTRPACEAFARIARTRSSSALRTAVPPGFIPSTSCALPSAMASTEPMNSRCTGATSVSTATSGGATRQWRAISPGIDIPISSTATSNSSGRAPSVSNCKTERATPSSLL